MEFKTTIKISPELFKLGDRVEAGIEAGLLRAAGAVEAAAVEEAPIQRGHLKDSIRKYIEGHRATITATAKYAAFVHGGTGIFGIHKTPVVPRTKKALAFRIGDRLIIRRSVKGIKPNPFMKRALARVESRLQEIFMDGFRTIIKI
jgi:HK97 gp10 family phage protein